MSVNNDKDLFHDLEVWATEFNCDFVIEKDFSILENFTTEELAAELCRRTPLGKELE